MTSPCLIRPALCQRGGGDSDPSPQEPRGVQFGALRAQHSFVNLDIQAHSGSNSTSYMRMSSVSLVCQSLWTSSKAHHLEHSVPAPWRVTSTGNPDSSFSVDTNQGLLTWPPVYCSYVRPHTTDELPRCQG